MFYSIRCCIDQGLELYAVVEYIVIAIAASASARENGDEREFKWSCESEGRRRFF